MFLSGYATATAADPELRHGHALGGSGGFILERSPWLQLDMRGVSLLARVPMHTMIAEAGPKVSRNYRWLRPYGEVLVGLGHTEYPPNGKGFGFTWTAVGGLDLRVTRHFDWRVGEYSYNHIYAGPGVSPTILNTGFVFRFQGMPMGRPTL